MAKGFFQELKHYKIYDISKNLEIATEEAKRLVGILKKYGIVKAVKASKPEYEDLSNQDIVLTDVTENNGDVEYVFDFVGVVMLEEQIFKCYPKYIASTSEPMKQLKQVLKVIKKYNSKEQLVYLYNGEEDNQIFNQLAVALHLLEDYHQYGVYNNQHEIIETNGEGEILWDRTINDTFALIQNNRPYYLELQTRNTVDDEMDYIRRLHESVLSQCTEKLKDTGILELFDIPEVEFTTSGIEEFGDMDYIEYRLEREMRTQFVTRKQTLLKTIYTYIANEKANQENINFNLYGTNSFNLVWENVCSNNFGSVLNEKLGKLPLKLSPEYESKKDSTLKNIIDTPVWYRNVSPAADYKVDTLRPDLICIYPVNSGIDVDYCFGIYDAKYYCINFEKRKNGWKVTGQPGVGDITKQYLYQLAYDDFLSKQRYKYVQNMFLCPQEEAEPDYGYVEIEMLHKIGNKSLENIAIVKLCAEEMYDIYLSGRKIEDISKYIPDVTQKENRAEEVKMKMKSEYGKFIYPKQIKRELGARLIYDVICPVAIGIFYGFDSYAQYGQIADAALKIEKNIKNLSEQELGDAAIVSMVLKKCFDGMDDISSMAEGKNLDKLTDRVMEFIKSVYLQERG